ncbi:hypothetical protein ILFOPFJJ_04545 [Ensifer psoraleae]|nr:hypothetical protein [Sinorhizobium psoraleae]
MEMRHGSCASRISSMRILHCTNRFKATIFKPSKATRGDEPNGRQRDWSPASGTRKDPSGSSKNSEQRTPPPNASPIRLATLLLPVANHLHDARWTSSPSGRFAFCRAELARAPSCTIFEQFLGICHIAMHNMHRCHSVSPLHKVSPETYFSTIDRGGALLLPAHPRYGLATLLLPVANQNKATPAGPPPRRALLFVHLCPQADPSSRHSRDVSATRRKRLELKVN